MSLDEPPTFIVIEAPNGDVREVELTESGVVIGRDPSADIQVDQKKISRRHAAFKVVEGEAFVEDLGSANGVKLNGRKVEDSAPFGPEDEVLLGGYRVTLRVRGGSGTGVRAVMPRGPTQRGLTEPRVRLIGRSPKFEGKIFDLVQSEAVVGRLEECDIVLNDGSVSRQHARFVFRPHEGELRVYDLESANGVWVNDQRVHWSDLRDSDRLTIGRVELRVQVPDDVELVAGREQDRVKVPINLASIALGGLTLVAATGVLVWTVTSKLGPEFAQDVLQLRSRLFASTASVAQAESEAPTPPEPYAPPPGAASAARRTQTATSPSTGRGLDGWPRFLPEVDVGFDLVAHVEDRLEVARRMEAEADYDGMEQVLRELLDRDPIHAEAQLLLDRARLYRLSERAFERARGRLAEGEIAKAYQILDEVPEAMPLKVRAQAEAAKLRDPALEDALTRAREASRRRPREAQELYKFVLRLEPEHDAGLRGLREMERRLRKKRVAFVSYRPKEVSPTEPSTDRLEPAIQDQYPSDPVMAAIVSRYAQGDLAGARRAVASGGRRSAAARRLGLGSLLDRIAQQRERARTEVSNDPSRAWAMLIELKELEARFMPAGSKSYLVRDLEVSLAEVFADRGAARFAEYRYEEAFQRWQAGFKLDPTHPEVRSGLAKLADVAANLAEEAEISSQRGDGLACERWKRITRITLGGTELHRRARTRVGQFCD